MTSQAQPSERRKKAEALRWLVLGLLAAAVLVPLADLWLCFAPPWPEHQAIVFCTMPVPLLVYFTRLSIVAKNRPHGWLGFCPVW